MSSFPQLSEVSLNSSHILQDNDCSVSLLLCAQYIRNMLHEKLHAMNTKG